MDALSFAKILLDDGNAMSLDRDFYHRELKKRANATRRDGESEAQAYVRVLETPEGVTLHEAYKRAPVAPAPVPAPQGIKPIELGVAATEMNRKAKALAALVDELASKRTAVLSTLVVRPTGPLPALSDWM